MGRADRAGTCRGTSKVPIEGLLRSHERDFQHARPACSSPPGHVSTRPGGGQEPAGGPHRGPGAAPVPGLPAVQRDDRSRARCCRPTATHQIHVRLVIRPRMAALRTLKTTLNSLKSTRLLKTACVILNTCLHALNPNSRMTEDFHSLEVSRQWRKSRILSLLEPSCQLPRRREWATRSSLPSLTPATPSTSEDKKEAGSQYLYPPETKKAQITDTNVGYSPSSTMWGTQVFQLFVLSPVSDQFQQLVLASLATENTS